MSDPEFTEISDEARTRLWPQSESRPDKAWTHRLCHLVVTNRAAHLFGVHRCPQIGRRSDHV